MAKAERLKKRRWKLWLPLGLAGVLLVALGVLVTAPIFTYTSIHRVHPDVGLGPTTLEERIIVADVIARVKLRSVVKTTEKLVYEESKDVDALEFTFDALEYLKGSGGSQLKAVAIDEDGWYDREDGVVLGFEIPRSGVDFLKERDTQWDDREAIVFLQKREEELPSTKQADRYRLGSLSNIGLIEYAISSAIHRHWLPSVAAPTPTAGGSGVSTAPNGDNQRFLLEEPGEAAGTQASASAGGENVAETITLSGLKALIASVQAEVTVGQTKAAAENYAALRRGVGSGWLYRAAGSNTTYTMEEYKECVRSKYEWRRIVHVMLGGYDTFEGSNFQGVYDVELDSGMAAGAEEIFFWPHFATPGRPTEANIGMNHGGEWIGGRDGELFVGKLAGVRTARPLLEGEYMLYFSVQGFPAILCDAIPEAQKKRTKIIVKVDATPGTLHEAFFDPVTDGTAIAADATNGVLKPTAFTDANSVSATLQRIAWEAPSTGSGQAGAVKLKLTPHTGLANHVVDFIGLDGKVILSLDADDATVDAANNTLSWPVTHQPWKDGDKLMLRIHNGSVTPVPTPTPAPTPAAPTGLTATAGAGSVTLTWNNPSDSTITGYEYQSRWTGVAWQPWKAISGSGSSTTSHTVTGLTNGTEYRFHVRAVNANGAGTAAPNADPWYVSATPKAPLPAVPTGLTATAGNGSVTLSWNNPSDSSITGYEYQARWAGVAWQSWKAIPNSGSSMTSYTVTGLTNGTEYRFHVRAVNASGAGPQAPNADPWYVSATPGRR